MQEEKKLKSPYQDTREYFSLCTDPENARFVLKRYGYSSRYEVLDAVDHVMRRVKS
jgi:hypothetical protein